MISLDEVKSFLRKTDNVNDDDLDELRRRAIATVERALDWYFGPPRPKTEIQSGADRPTLWLKQPPVEGLVVSCRAGPVDPWETVDDEDYEVDGRGVTSATYWPLGYRNVRFQYDEGFVDPPLEVVQLVLELIASKWLRRGKGDLKSETLGRYSYTRGDLENSERWGTVKNNWKRGRI